MGDCSQHPAVIIYIYIATKQLTGSWSPGTQCQWLQSQLPAMIDLQLSHNQRTFSQSWLISRYQQTSKCAEPTQKPQHQVLVVVDFCQPWSISRNQKNVTKLKPLHLVLVIAPSSQIGFISRQQQCSKYLCTSIYQYLNIRNQHLVTALHLQF